LSNKYAHAVVDLNLMWLDPVMRLVRSEQAKGSAADNGPTCRIVRRKNYLD